jgi:predicted DNA-binding transcriptional regulator AlpA
MAISKTDQIAQQLAAAKYFDDTLLKIEAVSAWVGWSRTKIYDSVNNGGFPAPLKFGLRCTRWRAGSIKAYLDEQRGSHAYPTSEAQAQSALSHLNPDDRKFWVCAGIYLAPGLKQMTPLEKTTFDRLIQFLDASLLGCEVDTGVGSRK